VLKRPTRWGVGGLVGLGLLVAACGGGSGVGETVVTAEQAARDVAENSRTDMAVRAVVESVGAGFEVTVGVFSVDQNNVITPIVSVDPGPGVALTPVPDECLGAEEAGFECVLTLIQSSTIPSAPAEVVLAFVVDVGVVDPTVTLTATSQLNPVSNDPDPTNNVLVVDLVG